MLKKEKRKTRKQNNTVRRRRKRRRDAKKESPSRSQTRARTRSSRNVCINTQNVPSENEEETDFFSRELRKQRCKYPKTPSPRQPLLLFYISFLFYSQPRRRTAQEYFTRDAKLPGDEERQVPKETHRPFTRFQGTDESRGVHDSFSRRSSRG